MLGFFKNLFGNRDNGDKDSAAAAPPPSAHAQPAPAANPFQNRPARPAATSPSPAAARKPMPVATSDGKSLLIPIIHILGGLPAELKARVRPTNLGDAALPVALDRVLTQLGSGAVHVSFGELRAAAPDLFVQSPELDETPVRLPLGEVLSRIDSALLARRPDQRHVEVPPEITSPFGDQGHGLAVAKPKSDTTLTPRSVAPPAPIAPPTPPTASPAATGFTQFTRKPALPTPQASQPSLAPKPTPAPVRNVAPPRVTPMTPPPAVSTPRPPVKPAQQTPWSHTPAPHSPSPAPVIPPKPVTPIAPAAAPIAAAVTPIAPAAATPTPAAAPEQDLNATPIPVSSALRSLGSSIGLATSPAKPAPAAAPKASPARPTPSVAAAAPAPQPNRDVPSLLTLLVPLTESWPEALRQEIAQHHLQGAQVAIPLDLLEESMRRGKVAFPWKTIRSWIRPAIVPQPSANDAAVVELSLKVLTPLFLQAKRELAKPRQKIAVDEKIPNLFFGFPQPEDEGTPAPAAAPVIPPPAAPVPSADTNFYVWNDSSDGARVDETDFKRKAPETNFTSRYATPNEVVAAAEKLDGVVGAIVALPDGLKVAAKLPADVNGDTLAGFLPQIFGKVSQCTKELRMGELNNLNFTVGNVPWKIFRVNAIFFAAYGRAGQGLPTAQLAALAAQLDRKKKQ